MSSKWNLFIFLIPDPKRKMAFSWHQPVYTAQYEPHFKSKERSFRRRQWHFIVPTVSRCIWSHKLESRRFILSPKNWESRHIRTVSAVGAELRGHAERCLDISSKDQWSPCHIAQVNGIQQSECFGKFTRRARFPFLTSSSCSFKTFTKLMYFVKNNKTNH